MATVKSNQPKTIQYICTYCGKLENRSVYSGRPMPGNCPRKERTSDGKMRPHTWRINRKI